MAVGQNHDVASLGEVVNLLRAYKGGELCSCGSRVNECEFWDNVVKIWKEKYHLDDRGVELFERMDRKFSHPRSFLGFLYGAFSVGSKKYNFYVRLLSGLFSVCAEVSGKSMLVDSSKSPTRFLALMNGGSGEVFPIHLVKNPDGILESLGKVYERNVSHGIEKEIIPKSSTRTGLYWVFINLVSEFVLWAKGREFKKIKYEDFVRDPQESLKDIDSRFEYKDPMIPGHLCAGNRMRLEKTITIKDEQRSLKRNRLPAFFVRPVYVFMKRRYGYL